MPPIGGVDVAPAWGWPDAAVGLVLAVSFCVPIVRAVSWLRRGGASSGRAWVVRLPEQAPVAAGLVLALTLTLLVRGHPDQQVLVGVVALALVGGSSIRFRSRVARRRPPDPAITSPPVARRC